jgi:hypothetical protein
MIRAMPFIALLLSALPAAADTTARCAAFWGAWAQAAARLPMPQDPADAALAAAFRAATRADLTRETATMARMIADAFEGNPKAIDRMSRTAATCEGEARRRGLL